MNTMKKRKARKTILLKDGFCTGGAQVVAELSNRLMHLYVDEEYYESAATLRDAHELFGSIALGYLDWTSESEDEAYAVLRASETLLDEVDVHVYADEHGTFASFLVDGFEYKFLISKEEAASLEG